MTLAEQALRGAEYLSDTRVWAAEMKTSARRWLRNFKDDEQEAAGALLDSFIYFPGPFVDRLFTAAFDGLAVEVCSTAHDYPGKKRAWDEFRERVLVTHPTGEMPNVTDSGYLFDRKARQLLEVPQEHIMEPEAIVATLVSLDSPVLFVDDFVGSGDQFVKTWRRRYDTSNGAASFQDLAADGRSFYYCPLVCTTKGIQRLQTLAGLRLRPIHELPKEYSVNDPSSLVWPDHLRAFGPDVVKAASARAGIPPDGTWGYSDLALTLAFEHGVPDATLPLFYWEKAGWVPLVRRR